MLNAERTLAIICGASAWPNLPNFEAAAAFANSAESFREYLYSANGLAVPEGNVLWLFNKRNAVRQYELMDQFLSKAYDRLKAPQGERTTLFLLYVGHGAFFGQNREYSLLIRDTRPPIEADTSLRLITLARVLRTKAAESSRILLLDCCFAGEAARYYQSSVQQAVSTKTHEVMEDAFADRGVAILCASSSRNPARLEHPSSFTLFGEALLAALREGDPDTAGNLTLRRVCTLVDRRLQSGGIEDYPKPEVHVPDQAGGDLAATPLFPNVALREAVTVLARPPALLIRILQSGVPVPWQERIRLDIASRNLDVKGLAPDINGIVELDDISPGPLIVRLRRGSADAPEWTLAPLRNITAIPTEIELELSTFPKDSWVRERIDAEVTRVVVPQSRRLARNAARDHHAPWGLPHASIVVEREAYVVGTEPGWRIPRWVAYRMFPNGKAERPLRFDVDERYPEAERVRPEDYRGSGFDRGHLVSPQDVYGLGQTAVDSTNIMSVIAPQHPIVNQRSWNEIEKYARSLEGSDGGLVVLAGPVFAVDGNGFYATRFSERDILVPDGFFRIITRNAQGQGVINEPDPLVFLAPNQASSSFTVSDSLTSLSLVESLTGLSFFGYSDPDHRARLRATGEGSLW